MLGLSPVPTLCKQILSGLLKNFMSLVRPLFAVLQAKIGSFDPGSATSGDLTEPDAKVAQKLTI